MKVIQLSIMILLFTVITLTSCKGADMQPEDVFFDFRYYVDERNYNDLCLAIYYSDLNFRAPIPVTLDDLTTGEFWTNKVIVTGIELAEHHDLFVELVNTELRPMESDGYIDARLYYTFEHKEQGEILSFLAFGDDCTVFINGLEVQNERVIYDIVMPFLPDEVKKTIDV